MKHNIRFLAVMLIIAMIQLPVFAEKWEDVERFSKEIDLVCGLGFMEAENSKEFFPDDLVDNAELVRILMNLRNSNTGDGQRRFQDVPESYYAFSQIDEAVNLGFITVGEDRMFYPEEKADATQAIRLMLYVMNYKVYLDSSGEDVRRTAQRAGLLDGLTLAGENITKGELAKLIYNSFSCKLMEMSGISGLNMVFKESEDKTTLSYHNWKMVEGRVTANDCTGLYYSASACGVGSIRIDDVEYYEGDSMSGALLGYDVEAVCTDSGDFKEKLIYAVADGKAQTLLVDAKDIVSVSEDKLKYNESKTISLRPDMCIIYNGVAVKFDASLLDIDYGEITFLSTGSSGAKYDIVLVNEYESYSVSGVSVSDGKIYLKNGTLNGRTYINITEDAGRDVTYYYDDKIADISSVTSQSIISVSYAEGEREVLVIRISDKTAEGALESLGVTQNRQQPTAVINSQEYIIGKNAVGSEKLTLGENFSLKLDYKGYIVEVEEVVVTKNYAAVLWAGFDEGENECILKLLKADGTQENIRTRTEKVRVVEGDISTNMTASEIYLIIQDYRYLLIVYETDGDNKIKQIELPVMYDRDNEIKNETRFTLYKEITTSTMASYGSIDGVGTDSSVIFIIPPGEEVDYSECSVQKGGYFAAGTNYNNVKFYDVGQSAQAGAVLVRAKQGSSINDFSIGIMIVQKKSIAINSDDEQVTRITGYQSGQQISLNVSPRNITDNAYVSEYDINKVDIGDILIYSTNSNGEISTYSVLYVDGRDSESFKQLCSLGNGYSTTRECSLYHADTRYVSDEYLTIEYADTTVPATVSSASGVIVYKVNRSDRSVEMGEFGDIRGKNFYTGEKGSEVVLRTSRNGVIEVVIYED